MVEVYVKDIDTEKKKISLGFKKAEDNPWEILKRDYKVGSTIPATIVNIASYGAFANILPGIDGLIHISQIADRRIDKPQDVLKIGDRMDVKITDIDFDKKRISLSIRALLESEDGSSKDMVTEFQENAVVASTDDMESLSQKDEKQSVDIAETQGNIETPAEEMNPDDFEMPVEDAQETPAENTEGKQADVDDLETKEDIQTPDQELNPDDLETGDTE